jgi:membrane associated rhomboid family serine protease
VFPLKDNLGTNRTPIVTIVLIAINTIVYFFLQSKSGIDFSGNSLNQSSLVHYGAIPYEFTHPGDHCDFVSQVHTIACEGQPGVRGHADHQLPTALTVFTSMFTHAGLLHLGGNMLFLWVFGANVEDSMTRPRFLAFYLLGGLAALAGQIIVSPNSTAPTLGASGAIAAVLGGYLLIYPRARVVTLVFIFLFFTIIEVPAIFFLGFWFLQQIAFGALDLTSPQGTGGGVAYFAHVGGFAFGLLAIKLFVTDRKSPPVSRYPVY